METKKEKKIEAKKEVKEVKQENQEVVVTPVTVESVPVPHDYRSKLTKSQIEVLKRTIAKGASDDELKMFLYICERTKLDPFTKQIHLVPRRDGRTGIEVRTPIVGIDGLRSIAERTENYAGNDDPVFDDEEKPQKATVTVYKMVGGQRVGFTASARWTQYYPGDTQGFMWKKMPHLMLGKCAEALALRKAFPNVMSGIYIREEMDQASIQIQPAQENTFETAKGMISQAKDAPGLEKLKEKIAGSKKYTKEQKESLVKVINAQITKLGAIPVID